MRSLVPALAGVDGRFRPLLTILTLGQLPCFFPTPIRTPNPWQSPNANDLGIYGPDTGINASQDKHIVAGHPVYSAYFGKPGMGMRNIRNTTGIALGGDPESMYMVSLAPAIMRIECPDTTIAVCGHSAAAVRQLGMVTCYHLAPNRRSLLSSLRTATSFPSDR